MTENEKSYIIFNMKQIIIFILLLSFLTLGCGTKSSQVTEEPLSVEEPEILIEEEPVDFDPSKISQETYESTKINVQQFIEELNKIISSRNYDAWKTHLSDDYFNFISSPDFLRTTSESRILRMQNIVLRTPQDYFRHVVVPSRANSRVDDIEFTNQYHVKVFTIDNARNERLRLYDLEQTGDTWKIIN